MKQIKKTRREWMDKKKFDDDPNNDYLKAKHREVFLDCDNYGDDVL